MTVEYIVRRSDEANRSTVNDMVNFWNNKNHKSTYEDDYNKWKEIKEDAKKPGVKRLYNNYLSSKFGETNPRIKKLKAEVEWLSELEEAKKNWNGQVINGKKESELTGYFKEKDELLEAFNYAGITNDDLEKRSDEELLTKLEKGQYSGKRGWHLTSKVKKNQELFEQAGGLENALKYIELRRKENEWAKKPISSINNKLDMYFNEVLKSANDFGLKSDHYKLLENALNHARGNTLNLVEKYLVQGKDLTLDEKLVLDSALLGKMLILDEYNDKPMPTAERENFAKYQDYLNEEIDLITTAAMNQYEVVYAKPTSDAEIRKQKDKVKEVVNTIYGREII